MNNDKSPAEVAAAIMEMRSQSPVKSDAKSAETRRKIEDMLIDKRAEDGYGSSLFLHEPSQIIRSNPNKGNKVFGATK